jgi:hypothetical protein
LLVQDSGDKDAGFAMSLSGNLADMETYDRAATFFAGAKLPSMNDSPHFSCWRSFNSLKKRAPDFQPDLVLPVSQSPPARRRRGKLFGQVAPTSPAAQNPQNAFQDFAVIGRRSPAVAAFPSSREQGPHLLPLGVGQQATASRHRPSFGAAHSAYRAFWENQLLQNHGPVPSFETASSVFDQESSESDLA